MNQQSNTMHANPSRQIVSVPDKIPFNTSSKVFFNLNVSKCFNNNYLINSDNKTPHIDKRQSTLYYTLLLFEYLSTLFQQSLSHVYESLYFIQLCTAVNQKNIYSTITDRDNFTQVLLRRKNEIWLKGQVKRRMK